MSRKMLVLNVAALSPWEIGDDCPGLTTLAQSGSMRPLVAPEPALTCTSHATMLTGLDPCHHGIIGNGWYDRESGQVLNWGRSDNLVQGEKIWAAAKKRRPDFKAVNLFWRYCTHSQCDVTLTERPTYFSNGRKGADIYGQPERFRAEVNAELGAFPFFNFWGPKASMKSSEWIIQVARKALRDHEPDLLLCYAPGLDYEGQRYGPRSPEARAVLTEGDAVFGTLIEEALALDMDVVVVSDYGFTEVSQPVFPNRALRRGGFITVDPAVNGELLEPGDSRAFAICDNQVAQVYVHDANDIEAVRQCLLDVPGIRDVVGPGPDAAPCLGHARSAELLAIAEPGCWFAYPYWLEDSSAPDFADCVDIFKKTGFDPCELFLKQGLGGKLHLAKRFAQLKLGIRAPFDVISTDYNLVRGARNVRPESPNDGAVVLTSWVQSDSSPLAMRNLKGMLLDRIFGAGS